TPNFPPSWNVAPTDNLPIVRYDPKAGHRTLDLMRWGLVPFWAKDIKIGFSTINAMAETIDTKPVFREAFARRRCIVPADNFYEWKKLGPKEKQPYAIALAGRSLTLRIASGINPNALHPTLRFGGLPPSLVDLRGERRGLLRGMKRRRRFDAWRSAMGSNPAVGLDHK